MKTMKTNDYKIYTVKELKVIKPGTVFEHCQLGKCMVMQDRDGGYKYMVFKKNSQQEAFFVTNAHPWDIPMKVIS
jgi:hypothetical protein